MKNLILYCCCITVFFLNAQESQDSARTSVDLSKEVINPTTLLWQIQLEEKLVTNYSNADGVGQKFRVRLIIPVKKGLLLPFPQLIRIIAFYNTLPHGSSGMGDITFNQFWILQEKKWGKWGLGYNLQIPTAKDHRFGSEQWQLGPAFTITFSNLGKWEMYWILQNFFSISDNDEYGSTSLAVLQPNIFYTWSNGFYMGMEPLWQLDYKTGDIDFPLNWRFGYIFRSKKFKYNTYIEPEWRTYRSENFKYNNEDFAIKFGFRIFLPEKTKK